MDSSWTVLKDGSRCVKLSQMLFLEVKGNFIFIFLNLSMIYGTGSSGKTKAPPDLFTFKTITNTTNKFSLLMMECPIPVAKFQVTQNLGRF